MVPMIARDSYTHRISYTEANSKAARDARTPYTNPVYGIMRSMMHSWTVQALVNVSDNYEQL